MALVAKTSREAPSTPRRETLLLPVCCVCGLIRDEIGTSFFDDQRWVTEGTCRETHGVNPADCLLTHTYCPGCHAQCMKAIRAA